MIEEKRSRWIQDLHFASHQTFGQVLCDHGVVTKRSHSTVGDGLPYSCCEQVLCDLSVAAKRPHSTEGDGLPSCSSSPSRFSATSVVAATATHQPREMASRGSHCLQYHEDSLTMRAGSLSEDLVTKRGTRKRMKNKVTSLSVTQACPQSKDMFEVAPLDTYVEHDAEGHLAHCGTLGLHLPPGSPPPDLRMPCIYAHERSSDAETKI